MPTAFSNSSFSLIFSILSLFDPRKWVGILFSILGVLASVVVPFLPARITKLLSRSNTTVVVVPRRSHVRNASQASQAPSATSLTRALAHHYPHVVSTPVTKPSNRRHTSLGLTTRPRPLTQRHSSYPSRVDSAPTSSSSSTAKIESDPNPYLTFRQPADFIYNAPVASPKPLQTYSLNTGIKSRQSLDSLDLATSTTTPPSIPLSLPSRKDVFSVSNWTDLEPCPFPNYSPVEDRPTSTLVTTTASTARGFPEIVHYETDWHGNDSFAVKRPVILPSLAEVLPVRRKPRREDSDVTTQLAPTTTPQQLEDLPLSASTLILDPSPSSGNSVLCHSVDSNNNVTGTVAFEQLVMPPERPMRTDPYKKFNIPAPGSERAMAFLKAEKEWIKAETERRKRESRASNSTVQQAANITKETTTVEPEKLDMENKKSCGKKNGHRRRHSFPARRKYSKDVETVSSPELGSGVGKDGENSEPLKLDISQTPSSDEFGVLPTPLSAVPEEDHSAATDDIDPPQMDDSPHVSTPQQRLSQGKRRWMFSKRSKTQNEGTKEKWKEETIEKKPERLKSRDDSKIKVPRISLMGVKDGGYVSDTAVTSLTYQLIS